jgi:hypothetical protein
MKRSKFFLGLTSGLLAIAGLVAAKSAKFHTFDFNFRAPNGACVAGGSVTNAQTALNGPQLTTGNGNNYKMYTGIAAPNSQCTDPIYIGQ